MSTLPDDETNSLADYSWKPSSEAVFDENGSIDVSWTLVDDKGAIVAFVTAVYDPVTKKFGSMEFTTAKGDGS